MLVTFKTKQHFPEQMVTAFTIIDREQGGDIIEEQWKARLPAQREEDEEERIRNLLSDATLFDFEAYCNAVKYLEWKNIQEGHETSAQHTKTIRRGFDNLIKKQYGEESEEETINGMMIARNPDINDRFQLYHSPSAMVTANLEYRIEGESRERMFQEVVGILSRLKTGFSLKYEEDYPTVELLGGVFTIKYDPSGKNEIIIEGQREKYWKQPPKRYMQYSSPCQWRGKVSRLANFVQTMEQACGAAGAGWMGHGNIKILFYGTQGSHEEDKAYPQEIIGMIEAEMPWSGAKGEQRRREQQNKGEIKVYPGKDMHVYIERVRNQFYRRENS